MIDAPSTYLLEPLLCSFGLRSICRVGYALIVDQLITELLIHGCEALQVDKAKQRHATFKACEGTWQACCDLHTCLLCVYTPACCVCRRCAPSWGWALT